MENAIQYLHYTGNSLLLIYVVVGVLSCYKWKTIRNYPVKWISFLCLSLMLFAAFEWLLVNYIFTKEFPYFVSDLLPLLQKYKIEDMTFIYPINYIIRFAFLSLFFRDILKKASWKQTFGYLFWILIAYELLQIVIFKSYQSGYDSMSSTIKNIIILMGTSLFFAALYRNQGYIISLQKNAYFWIGLGLMLPSLAELFIELVFETLFQTDLLMFYKVYVARNISQIFGVLLMLIGIYQTKYLRFLPKEY